MIRFFCTMLAATLCGPVLAARPLATEDPGVVERDRIELEAGLESLRLCGGGREQALGFVLKAGLAERLDLGIETPYAFEPESGWDAASLSVKYALVAVAPVPASLYFTHCLGGPGYGLAAVSSLSAGQFTFHMNAGFEAEGFAGGTAGFCYAAAMEYPAAGFAVLVGELTGYESELKSLLGARFGIGERMSLDLGVGFGVAESDARESFTAGLTLVL